MINQRLPEFNVVAAGRTSLLPIPRYALTLKEMELRLGGTMSIALIDEIRLKIGTSTRWSIKGTHLAAINAYKEIAASPLHVPILFSERDGKNIVEEEAGGWDLSKLPDQAFLEIDINAAAVNPTMYAMGWFTPPQGSDKSRGQVIQKYVKAVFQANVTGAARNQLAFDPKGALVKRAFFFYTGADFSPTTDGNLFKLEVKKNGGVVWEPTCLDARFSQVRYKHVPQSKLLVVDFIVDNNLSGALRSSDARALEWNAFVTAVDVITAVFDVLDRPNNL